MLGFAIAIAPVTITNALVAPRPELILTTWQAGPNFYIGNGPEATGTYQAPEFVTANPAFEADDFTAEARRRVGYPLTPGAVSDYWLRQGLAHWRTAPVASLRLLLKKTSLVWHNIEIPDNQDPESIRLVAAPALDWAFLSFGMLVPFAALGVLPAARCRFGRFALTVVAVGFGSTALFFVVGRYRVPWLPALIVLAAAGAVDLGRLCASSGPRTGAIGLRLAFLALPAALLAWRPIADPAPDRWGHSEIQLALADLGANDLDAAIAALDDARAISPGAARRVWELTSRGLVHDRLALLIRTRSQRNPAPSFLEQARWLRNLPEAREQSRSRLEESRARFPQDPRLRFEEAAWWLCADPSSDGRARAVALLRTTKGQSAPDPSGAIVAALLLRDPSRLPAFVPQDGQDVTPARLRLARAILSRTSPRTREP